MKILKAILITIKAILTAITGKYPTGVNCLDFRRSPNAETEKPMQWSELSIFNEE